MVKGMNLRLAGQIISLIVQSGCLVLLIIGLWYIFGNSIKNLFREEYHYRKLEKTVSAKKVKEANILVEHIIKVLSAVLSHDVTKTGAYIFIISSISIFIFSFLMLIKLFSLNFSLTIALTISAFPYALAKIKLRSVRIDSSYDADSLVTSITNEYKQHYFNMIKAIENCAVKGMVGSYSERNLFRLSLALKSYHSEENLDSAIEQFVYSYDTKWAALLSLNIKMAIHRGLNVSSGLEDILTKLKDIREQIEVSNRYNNEAATMIKVLLVPLYIGTIYISVSTLGFTVKKFFQYQFLNPVGLRMGIITFLGMALSFMALTIISKPKYDI